MRVSRTLIKEIASELDCGMMVYLHKHTHALISIYNEDTFFGEKSPWAEALIEVENNRDAYIEIEKMTSREAFKTMENFVKQVSNSEIKKRLEAALNRRKPFQQFKGEVDYHEQVRQQWFEFKTFCYEEWVRKQLEYANLENE